MASKEATEIRARMKAADARDALASARTEMREWLTDLHALSEALDDAPEGLGDELDTALGIVEGEAKETIKRYGACILATQR